MKKRVYLKNKTAGKQRGQKWDERIKTAAICDMMVESNLCVVARRYGIPESTLRTWRDAARKKGGADFEKARADALRAIQHKAAQGAVDALDALRMQLDEDRHNREICRRARREMEELRGIELVGEDGIRVLAQDTPEIRALQRVIDEHRPINEMTAGIMLRTLAAVQDRTTAAIQKEETEAEGFVVAWRDADAEERSE